MELESFRNLSRSCPKPFGDLSGNSQEFSGNRSEALGPSYGPKWRTCRRGDPPKTSRTVQSMGVKCPQVPP